MSVTLLICENKLWGNNALPQIPAQPSIQTVPTETMTSKPAAILNMRARWHVEMETMLLQLVENKPHLWDSTNENYLKKNTKRRSFEAIGSVLKGRWPEYAPLFTPESIQSKFANLRTYYRRELRKMKQFQGTEQELVPKWEHFKHMSFMSGLPLQKQGPSKSDDSSVDSTPAGLPEISIKDEILLPDIDFDAESMEHASTPVSRSSVSPVPCTSTEDELSNQNKRKRKRKHSEESSHTTPNDASVSSQDFSSPALPSSSLTVPNHSKESDSSDAAFCHYLQTLLSAIPDSFEKEMVKIKIMETVLKLKYPDKQQ